MYKVDGKEYSYDSIVNQRIKDKFVDMHVLYCVTGTTEYILSKSYEDAEAPFNWEQVVNLSRPVCDECYNDSFNEVNVDNVEIFQDKDGDYICPFCGCCNDTEQEARECCMGAEDYVYQCSSCGKYFLELSDATEQENDIFEWRQVSSTLAHLLEEEGETIIEDEDIWGRGCTGQSISMDGVISNICYKLEILEGQKYEWEE